MYVTHEQGCRGRNQVEEERTRIKSARAQTARPALTLCMYWVERKDATMHRCPISTSRCAA